MKFKIQSVDNTRPLEEVYPVLKEFNFTPMSIKRSYFTEHYGFINLSSLEGLMMLEGAVDCKLIIERNKPLPVITIYDDYIE